jgi:hypothetical protein
LAFKFHIDILTTTTYICYNPIPSLLLIILDTKLLTTPLQNNIFLTMASKLLRFPRFAASTRFTTPLTARAFSTSRILAVKVDSSFISQITAAEKIITNTDELAKGGPTAAAQSHVGQELNSQVVHDITVGERKITGNDQPIQGGPTSVAQSFLTGSGGNATSSSSSSNSASNARNTRNAGSSGGNAQHNGILDSNTISKITEKEKQLTGNEQPAQGGPTARAQQHANEPITSQALHDITEGEKKITGGERVKGGPTSAAQSELGKSRS